MSTVGLDIIDEGVLQVTFMRPEALNTLNWTLVRDFLAVMDEVERDAGARVVVLTGAGRAFCAGFDLSGYGDEERLAQMGTTRGLLVRQQEISEMVTRLYALKVPGIAAINAHDYRRAWLLGGDHSGSTYAAFTQGFKTTKKDSVSILEVSGDAVRARVTALQSDGTVQIYQGFYIVQDGAITGFKIVRIG